MKKFTALLLLTALLSCFFCVSSYATEAKDENTPIIGDANGDNAVNAKDATFVQKHCAKILTITGDSALLADVDNDNDLTVKDATMIKKYSAKITDSFIRKTIESENKNENITEYGLAKNLEQGAVFHAWCWSFNTIKENLDNIAASGFTSVQTSPISECKVGEDGGLEIYGAGKWYYHYQPTKFTIGNYQLGTKEEFIQLCAEAHKRGMNIIVDAVVNHCSSDYSAIDSSVKNISGGAFHSTDGIYWSQENRYYETQGRLSLLWDLNTQNPNVQKMIKNYLVECVASGADGFRYDTAKLIELPDDHVDGKPEFASNFWNVVLDNGAKWQYGENLQDAEDNSVCRLSDYAKLMDVTASKYGEKIRDAVNTGNLSASYISDYLVDGLSPDSLVTWVESHDNYCNENTWSYIDEQETVRAWAIIAARKGGTPLFFSRPKNSTSEDPWGDNRIGEAGSNLYKAAEITEVNFFRNAMGDSDEYMSNPTGDNSLLMIERGDSGFVLVNSGKEDVTLRNAPAKAVKDGVYKDQVSGSSFTVTNGSICGSIKAGRVAVVYNKTGDRLTHQPTVDLSVASGSFYGDSMSVSLIGKSCSGLTCKVNVGTEKAFSDGDMITLGEGIQDGEKVTVTVTGVGSDNKKYEQTNTYTKCAVRGDTAIYYDVKSHSGWGDVYAYVYNDSGITNAAWPGVKMTEAGNGKLMYTLPYKLERTKSYVIFNNGGSGSGNQYPEADGLVINPGETKLLNYSNVWENSPLKTLYFRNTLGWNKVNVYFWGEENTSWPGGAAGRVSGESDLYRISLYGDKTSVIFNDGAKNQTANIDCFIDGQLFTPDGSVSVDSNGQNIYGGSLTQLRDNPLGEKETGYKQIYFRSMTSEVQAQNTVYAVLADSQIKMTKAPNSMVWTAYIPESASVQSFSVKASSGKAVCDISVADMGGCNCCTALSASKTVWNDFGSGAYPDAFTIYFDNSKCKFGDVYIYGWGTDGLQGFAKMDYVKNNIYSYTFIIAPEKGKKTFLFADGTEWAAQTDDAAYDGVNNMFNGSAWSKYTP